MRSSTGLAGLLVVASACADDQQPPRSGGPADTCPIAAHHLAAAPADFAPESDRHPGAPVLYSDHAHGPLNRCTSVGFTTPVGARAAMAAVVRARDGDDLDLDPHGGEPRVLAA